MAPSSGQHRLLKFILILAKPYVLRMWVLLPLELKCHPSKRSGTSAQETGTSPCSIDWCRPRRSQQGPAPVAYLARLTSPVQGSDLICHCCDVSSLARHLRTHHEALGSRSEFTNSPENSPCHRFQTEAPIEAKPEGFQIGTSRLLTR